jgi:hypothetical protein
MVQNLYTAVDTPTMGRVVFNDNLLSFSLSLASPRAANDFGGQAGQEEFEGVPLEDALCAGERGSAADQQQAQQWQQQRALVRSAAPAESVAAGSVIGGGAERPNVNLTLQQRILLQLDDDPPDLNPLSEHSRPSRTREAAPVAGAPKTHAYGA